jgi:alkanesulfonate monooxygenase SsuD/methylene tetrahydromethanopterin reductase-like flavin-dependent oxidoreductase (luciferase family)
MVGTGGPRMSAITARHADEWNVWGNHERVGDALDVINRSCDKAGRDPKTLRRTAQAFVFFADNAEHAEKIRLRAPADRSLIGNADQLVEQISWYANAGIDEFIVPDLTLGKTASERLDSYERLRTEVIPHV